MDGCGEKRERSQTSCWATTDARCPSVPTIAGMSAFHLWTPLKVQAVFGGGGVVGCCHLSGL